MQTQRNGTCPQSPKGFPYFSGMAKRPATELGAFRTSKTSLPYKCEYVMRTNYCQINEVTWLSALLLVVQLLSQCKSAQVVQDTAQEVLQRYSESARHLRTLHAKATVFFGENREFQQHYECVVDVQQKKFLQIQSDSSELAPDRSTYYRESVADIASCLTLTLGQDKENEIQLSGFDEFSSTSWNVYFSQTHFAAPLHFHELIGIAEPMYSFMESIPSNIRTEKENGSEYVVLLAETKGCLIEVWLDRQKDFAVKKFLFRSEKDNDLARGVKMYSYEVNEFGLKKDFYFPLKVSTELASHKREQNILIPGHSEPEKRMYPERIIKKEIHFSDVEVNPKLSENSFCFRITPPNYTSVLVLDKPQIGYVWLDGKVVPLTNGVALANARGHGFIPGRNEPRFWMMALGIIFILAGLGKMLYNYFIQRLRNKEGEA